MTDEIAAYIGQELGKAYVSGWMLVDQQLIDRFADTTRDWNFIHVDPEKAGQTPYGSTIAHGFLVLSLLAPLRSDIPRPSVPGSTMGVNYGIERLRFISAVRSGSRIRGHFTTTRLEEVKPGQLREEMEVTIEIEGEERPAIVCTWLTMHFF